MHELRKKLARNQKYNPFSDHYDKVMIWKDIESYSENPDSEEAVGLIHTMIASNHLHDYFEKGYSFLKEKLFDSNLSIDEVIKFSISSVNRQYLIVRNELIKNFLDKKEINNSFFYGQKISSIDSSIGQIDAASAVEGLVDALNLLCTYVRYFENKLPSKKSGDYDIKSIESIKKLNMGANVINILKSEYDKCIWNQGYSDIDFETKRIVFRFINKSNLRLKKIGFLRLQKNVMSFNHLIKERVYKDKEFKELLRKSYRKNKNPKKIKSIAIKEGYITFKLASGYDKQEFIGELGIDNEFKTFYNFIEDTKMPQLDNMSLNDVVRLFSVTQHLFEKVKNIEIEDDSVFKVREFDKFAHKIKVKDLRNYLFQRTSYSSKQISQFLDLLTCPKDQRINFWNYPLIRINNDFIFPLLTITSPITTVLADKWLEDGGFSLDGRGKLFEKHIIRVVSSILKYKRYFFQIPKNDVLTNSKGAKEEIDLIVNLKSICLIAEVKCIKFALDARDEHNAIKRLEKGAKQVNRKAKFIKDNSNDLIEEIGNIQEKRIVKVVVTNYPIYSGYILEGVPVIDFFMLESYFQSGTLSNYKQTTEKGKHISSELISEKKLYKSEDEFCDKLDQFLYRPDHIYDHWGLFDFEENKISTENMDWDIYIESFNYK